MALQSFIPFSMYLNSMLTGAGVSPTTGDYPDLKSIYFYYSPCINPNTIEIYRAFDIMRGVTHLLPT
jgi:hypothetical protein